jgi:hypothetical protein
LIGGTIEIIFKAKNEEGIIEGMNDQGKEGSMDQFEEAWKVLLTATVSFEGIDSERKDIIVKRGTYF